MKALHCAIKREYLDMIQAGTKDTEYREITPYWVERLCEIPSGTSVDAYRSDLISGKVQPKFKTYTHITFHCQGDTLTLPITGIRTYKGHKWFAIGLDNSKLKEK